MNTSFTKHCALAAPAVTGPVRSASTSSLRALTLCVSRFTLLLLAGSALAQTSGTYENDGQVLVPPYIAPNIDATNFINKGQFIINFTNIDLVLPIYPPFAGIGPPP